MKHLLIRLVLGLLPLVAQAQPDLDPLRSALAKARHDTVEVDLLNQLAAGYVMIDPDSAITFGERALTASERLDHAAGRAEALKNIGYGHMMKDENAVAQVFFRRALAASEALGDRERMANAHHLLGNVAEELSDFPEALQQYLTKLKWAEEAHDSLAMADMMGAIGNVHDQMSDSLEAERWQRDALRISEALRDSLGIARRSQNLGTILDSYGKHDEALKYLTQALNYARALGNPIGIAICTGSMANHYQRLGDFGKALEYDQKVLADYERMNDTYNAAGAMINCGEILTQLKRYDEAEVMLNKGLATALSILAKQWIANAHSGLYELAVIRGDDRAALAHFTAQIAYRDSITNEANTRKAVQVQMQYDFDKKEAEARAQQEQKDQRQRLVRNGIAGGLGFALIFLVVVWRQRNKISKARKRSDELLLNILPEEVAEELKDTGTAQAKHFDTATILFTDFKGFTQLSEQVTPAELVAELNACFKIFDGIMGQYKIEKIKTIGDAYMAAGGLPDPQHGSPADVVRAALEMQDFMKKHKTEREAQGKPFFEMRVGIHSGPVVAGIVGVKKFQYDIWGDTVNTASRMESSGEVGQVNISESTYALVKDASTPLGTPAFTFTSRGKVQAKGKGEMEMYFVMP